MIKFWKVALGHKVLTMYPSLGWATKWRDTFAPDHHVTEASDEEAKRFLTHLEVCGFENTPHAEVLRALLEKTRTEEGNE